MSNQLHCWNFALYLKHVTAKIKFIGYLNKYPIVSGASTADITVFLQTIKKKCSIKKLHPGDTEWTASVQKVKSI